MDTLAENNKLDSLFYLYFLYNNRYFHRNWSSKAISLPFVMDIGFRPREESILSIQKKRDQTRFRYNTFGKDQICFCCSREDALEFRDIRYRGLYLRADIYVTRSILNVLSSPMRSFHSGKFKVRNYEGKSDLCDRCAHALNARTRYSSDFSLNVL